MDSRYVVYIKSSDSVSIINIEENSESYIGQSRAFKLLKNKANEWISYQLPNNDLVLYDVMTGKKKIYPQVKEYLFNENSGNLILKTENKIDVTVYNKLKCVNINNTKESVIWDGAQVNYVTFDKSGKKIAFAVNRSTDPIPENEIWFFEEKVKAPQRLPINYEDSAYIQWIISGYSLQFSLDGRRIF